MKKLGIVMDPIATIKPEKDSSLAMLLAAQKRGWQLFYMEQTDLFIKNSIPYAQIKQLTVKDDDQQWFKFINEETIALSELDVILMRKDPPVDNNFTYTTHILELAEQLGTLIVNKASSLRNFNEKLATAYVPQCCTETLVSCDKKQIESFLAEQKKIILKPLDSMGGDSIFYLHEDDQNCSVILETITKHGSRLVMAQKYISEISATGDKRILMVDGEPIPYALARIPADGEIRGNLAAGGRGQGVELTERDYWICQQVEPILKEHELLFVGLDVIGDYLTEINVTSPTCIRELDRLYNLDIASQLIDAIEQRI